MIVIGSYALALLGQRPFHEVRDLDLIGSPPEIDAFRERCLDIIESEHQEHGHRHVFYLNGSSPLERVEIDFEQSPSDQMLAELCRPMGRVLDAEVLVPSLEVLYLIKRAHANVPVHYDKTIRDIIQLKPLISPIGSEEQTFYLTRKRECQSRYMLNRQRFSLSVRNEDFFDLSDHVRTYVHDDLHEAVAHELNQPLYKRCKRDLSLAKIDVDLFELLSVEERLRMVQEEFMVIGLERFYLHDKSLTPPEVYARGMHKTIRDLFVGYFQDFCIDHIDQLLAPPAYDFVERFESALRDGRINEINTEVPPASVEHRKIWQLINDGQMDEARSRSEDLVRRAVAPGDTHAFFLLGVILLKNNQFGQAEQCLRHCVGRDRKNSLAWYNLGLLCRLTGRPSEAVTYFQRASQLGLGHFGLHWNLGLAYEAVGQHEAAIRSYTEARLQKREAPNLERRLANLLAGKTAEAKTG